MALCAALAVTACVGADAEAGLGLDSDANDRVATSLVVGDLGAYTEPDVAVTRREVGVGVADSDVIMVTWKHVWGAGRTLPPDGEFIDVSVNSLMSCGVRAGGSLVCWPDERFGGELGPTGTASFEGGLPEGEFTKVSLTADADYQEIGGGCALSTSGELACWVDQRWGNRDGVAHEPPSGRFLDIGALGDGWCAVRADGAVVCWGLGYDGHQLLADSGYERMTDWYCALDSQGTLGCPGEDGLLTLGGSQVPGWVGRLIDYHWAGSAACGLRFGDGRLACWDWSTGERRHLEGFDDAYTQVDGAYHENSGSFRNFCAVRVSGEIDCTNEYASAGEEETRMPSGRFVKVSVGTDHACAIRDDQTVACWGAATSSEETGLE